MTRAIILLALLAGACAPNGGIDVCKYANVRRATYTAAITAADAYAASGRVVPYELSLARLAAVTALDAIDRNCPVGKAS